MTTIDEGEFEKATLMPNRWYIILRKIDEESFQVSAYDTTTEEDDEFYKQDVAIRFDKTIADHFKVNPD